MFVSFNTIHSRVTLQCTCWKYQGVSKMQCNARWMCWSYLITQGQQNALFRLITNVQRGAIMFMMLYNIVLLNPGCTSLTVVLVYVTHDAILSHRHSLGSTLWIFSIYLLMKYSFLYLNFTKHFPSFSWDVFGVILQFKRELWMRENQQGFP